MKTYERKHAGEMAITVIMLVLGILFVMPILLLTMNRAVSETL